MCVGRNGAWLDITVMMKTNLLEHAYEDTQRMKLKRLVRSTVSTTLDMKTRKSCWQLCASRLRSSVKLRRGVGLSVNFAVEKDGGVAGPQESWQKQGER